MDLTGRLVREKAREYPNEVDNYEIEEKLLEILPVAFAEGTWQWDDLEDIVHWKSGRFGGANVETLSENPKREIEDTINEVVKTNSAIQKVKRLRSLDGVRVRMASALLLFMDPTAYTVLDTNAWETLQDSGNLYAELPDDPDTDDYLRYLGVCHTLASDLSVELRTLDRSLWVIGGDP
jgi:hypothetical protein